MQLHGCCYRGPLQDMLWANMHSGHQQATRTKVVKVDRGNRSYHTGSATLQGPPRAKQHLQLVCAPTGQLKAQACTNLLLLSPPRYCLLL